MIYDIYIRLIYKKINKGGNNGKKWKKSICNLGDAGTLKKSSGYDLKKHMESSTRITIGKRHLVQFILY